MKTTIKSISWLFLLLCSHAYGQMAQYNYKSELKGITEQWHKVVLPNDIYQKVSNDFSDIRIYGITANNDTIESPYLINTKREEVSSAEVAFKMLNPSHKSNGYYYTFEVPTTEPINQIKLEFNQQNFDWRLKLEGSQNQQEWFTVTEDYRVLSIVNEIINFKYTDLNFPSSKYRYFRLHINSKVNPKLAVSTIIQNEITSGELNTYKSQNTSIKENKKDKQTEVEIKLQIPESISNIKIGITSAFDYYRPFTIQYLTDSFKTEQGWKYNYSYLTSGILNSIEKNEFKFSSLTTQHLKVIIDNNDNQPLKIDTIVIKGYVHELVSRFTEPATYFLTYGNINAANPQYDITRFTKNIPENLSKLELGSEVSIDKVEAPVVSPLFENQYWLWGIMAVLILLLGWFSVKMLRNS